MRDWWGIALILPISAALGVLVWFMPTRWCHNATAVAAWIVIAAIFSVAILFLARSFTPSALKPERQRTTTPLAVLSQALGLVTTGQSLSFLKSLHQDTHRASISFMGELIPNGMAALFDAKAYLVFNTLLLTAFMYYWVHVNRAHYILKNLEKVENGEFCSPILRGVVGWDRFTRRAETVVRVAIVASLLMVQFKLRAVLNSEEPNSTATDKVTVLAVWAIAMYGVFLVWDGLVMVRNWVLFRRSEDDPTPYRKLWELVVLHMVGLLVSLGLWSLPDLVRYAGAKIDVWGQIAYSDFMVFIGVALVVIVTLWWRFVCVLRGALSKV